jgi:hypothetical protein
MKEKVYISGPMKGYINLNKESFENAFQYLYSIGYHPISPVDIGNNISFAYDNWDNMNEEEKYDAYLKEDIKYLMECKYIYMLDDWEKSKGATFEKYCADMVNIKQLNNKIV